MKRKTCFQLCILVALVALMLPIIGASPITSAMMNDTAICNVLPGNGGAVNGYAIAAVTTTIDVNNLIIAMAATNQSAGAIAKKQLIPSTDYRISGVDFDLIEFDTGATICAAEPGTAGADSLKFPMVSSSLYSSLTAG